MPIDAELLRSRWFARQPPALRTALAAAGREVRLAPGQWVYGEGDDATGIVAVLSGMLRLEASAGSRTVLIGTAPAGAVFGQSARRGGGPRIVTARAGPASRVLTIGDAALERIGAEHPEVWRAVSELVYGQLDASVHGLALTLALPPRARIAARLLVLDEDGVARISQADLAELCGLSRKSANAHLAALEIAGAIRRGYATIMLLDRPTLERAIG